MQRALPTTELVGNEGSAAGHDPGCSNFPANPTYPDAMAASSEDGEPEGSWKMYDFVEVIGLTQRAEMNGTRAVVQGWENPKRKYKVVACLSGTPYLLDVSKLKAATLPKKVLSATSLERLARYRCVEGDYDYGGCASCGKVKLGLLSPFCLDCGESVCAGCFGEVCQFCSKSVRHIHNKAIEKLTKLCERGDPRAFFGLAVLQLVKGEKVFEASRRLLVLVSRGFAEPMIFLATQCFQNGMSKEGVRWLEAGIRAGSAEAYYRLGVVYDAKQAPESDKRKAREFFERAIERDPSHDSALFRLGRLAKEDNLDFFKKSAKLGNTEAMGQVAHAYMVGTGGVAKHFQHGVDWLCTAAFLGHEKAQHLMIKVGVVTRFPPKEIWGDAPKLKKLLIDRREYLRENGSDNRGDTSWTNHIKPSPFYSPEATEYIEKAKERYKKLQGNTEAFDRWKPLYVEAPDAATSKPSNPSSSPSTPIQRPPAHREQSKKQSSSSAKEPASSSKCASKKSHEPQPSRGALGPLPLNPTSKVHFYR